VTAAEQLRVEGILEGERRVLLRQLRQKFGGLTPDLEKRIAAAELADFSGSAWRARSSPPAKVLGAASGKLLVRRS
tara:strand:+ start:1154 stop:1381 length:228 start_codon:yes stop_codon:yes gene_type:complete